MTKDKLDGDLPIIAEELGDRMDELELELDPAPNLEIDVSDYLPDIADLDGTEEQHIELLETLAQIMWTAVQIGFTQDICGWIWQDANSGETRDSDRETITLTPNKDEENNPGEGGAE